MPRKKLPMRKITEVLRLNAQGLSQRQIALSAGMSKTTVREYLSRAEKAGVGWPLAEAVTAEALEAALFPPPVVVPAALRPVPDWRAVHKELKRKDCHVTLRLLWLEWKEANPALQCSNERIHAAISRVVYDSAAWQPAIRQDGEPRPGGRGGRSHRPGRPVGLAGGDQADHQR